MSLTILQEIHSEGVLAVLQELWHNHWQLIVFLVLMTIGIKILFTLAMTALYLVKRTVIFHYVGILVMAITPTIQAFLREQDVIQQIPTIAGYNVSIILMGLITLNLTRIISKQLFRRF